MAQWEFLILPKPTETRYSSSICNFEIIKRFHFFRKSLAINKTFAATRKRIPESALDFPRLILSRRKKNPSTDLCEKINAFNGCCKKCERIEKFLGVDTKDLSDGLMFLFGILIVDTKHLFNKENG